MTLSCGCAGAICKCSKIASSTHPYLCKKEDCVVLRRKCCEPSDEHACAEPICAEEYEKLRVTKEVLAACPPSKVRELLPIVCPMGTCPVPLVSYLFEIEIKNLSKTPVELTAIYDSLTLNGGFLSLFTATISAQLVPSDFCATDPTVVTEEALTPGDLLDSLGDLDPITLNQCDCLRIQIHLQAKDQNAQCICVLEQEVEVLGCLQPSNTPVRRTTCCRVPL